MTDPDALRGVIGSILGRPADEAILAPGALVALRLVLHESGVSTLLLSGREYYGPEHFPGISVRVAPFDDLVETVARTNPDAVLASLVSWRGRVGDIDTLGRRLGIGAQDDAPLFCVDWCHAGAAGFPSAVGLAADLIVGDATKWITPAAQPDRIAFLLGVSPRTDSLERCFEGFYLSGAPEHPRSARWVDPSALAQMLSSVPDAALDPDRRTAWHARNLALARRVAAANGVSEPESAIVWLPDRTRSSCDLSALPADDLAWETGGGVRILCQAGPVA